MQRSQSARFSHTLRGSGPLTWIVFYTNKTEDENFMMNRSTRIGVVVYGSLLTVVTVVLHLLLLGLLLASIRLRTWKSSHWLIIQWSISTLSLGLTTFPLTVSIENTEKWPLSDFACRGWLIAKVSLQAISMWTLVAITVDKCVYAVQPLSYPKRITGWKIGILSFISLFFGVLGAVPTMLNMGLEESVLVEVCALKMTKVHALATAGLVYIIPGVGSLLGCVSAVCLFTRARRYPPEQCCHHRSSPCDKDHCWLDILSNELRLVRHSVCVTASVCAVYVLLWSPFYIFYVWIPFCEGHCLNPIAWCTMRWIGHSAAAVATGFWFMDSSVRQTITAIKSSRKGHYAATASEDYSEIDQPFVAKVRSAVTLDGRQSSPLLFSSVNAHHSISSDGSWRNTPPKQNGPSNIRLGISGLGDVKF